MASPVLVQLINKSGYCICLKKHQFSFVTEGRVETPTARLTCIRTLKICCSKNLSILVSHSKYSKYRKYEFLFSYVKNVSCGFFIYI